MSLYAERPCRIGYFRTIGENRSYGYVRRRYRPIVADEFVTNHGPDAPELGGQTS